MRIAIPNARRIKIGISVTFARTLRFFFVSIFGLAAAWAGTAVVRSAAGVTVVGASEVGVVDEEVEDEVESVGVVSPSGVEEVPASSAREERASSFVIRTA
jgi:hypothetical protein